MKRRLFLVVSVVLALLIVAPSVEAAWTVTNGWLRNQLERIVELGTTPTNGQVLTYDSTSGKYEPSRTITIGTPATTLLDAFHAGQAPLRIQIDETDAFYAIEQLTVGNNAAVGWNEYMKSRSTDGTTRSIVQADDDLAYFLFRGDDGANFISAAGIRVEVDGTPGVNDMPGRIVFNTTADGASSTTERVRIDSAGKVTIQDLKTTGAATGKKVVCVDTVTGILYASSTGVDCLN